MTQLYTDHDRNLCQNGLLLQFAAGYDQTGTQITRSRVQTSAGTRLLFQFPPKIKEDSRTGRWEEREVSAINQSEPLATYKSGSSRMISLEWTYIVADPDWDVTTIQNQLRTLRRYFVNPVLTGAPTSLLGGIGAAAGVFHGLVVFAQLWGVGGFLPMSMRLHDCKIKHGETMIGTSRRDASGNPGAFPLRTDINVSLRSWPTILNFPESGVATPLQAVPGQIPTDQTWF